MHYYVKSFNLLCEESTYCGHLTDEGAEALQYWVIEFWTNTIIWFHLDRKYRAYINVPNVLPFIKKKIFPTTLLSAIPVHITKTLHQVLPE